MSGTNFTTPVGRLVAGSVHTPNTTDMDGRPLLIKNGPDAGKPRVDYFFAVAIPKGNESAWWETEWGQKILAQAQADFPGGQTQLPTFAWKIIDGDSQVPNMKGKKPCDQEGYAHCWVIRFSGSFAPRLFNKDGSQQLTEPDAIKAGYYVQVNADVVGNGNHTKPGVYINHRMVALAGYGPEIEFGPDGASAGFGQSPLPAGASDTPVGGFAPAPATPPQTGQPGMPAMPTPGATVPGAMSLSPAAAPTAAGDPRFLQPPGVSAPPPAPSGPQMTAQATTTYEEYRKAGWTDEQLRQHGLML